MRSEEPQKGRKEKPWSSTSLSGGGELRGWVAGPMIGVNGHMIPPFKPCYRVLTGGAVECPHCLDRPMTWQGFLPIYDASGYPVVVLLQEYHIDAASSLKVHEQVTFKKGGEKYDRIVITPGKSDHWYRATTPARQRQADIRHWLIFTLWKKEAQLVNHYLAHPFTNELPEMERAGFIQPGAVAPAAAVAAQAEASDIGVSTRADQPTRRPMPKDAGDSYDAVVNRVRQKAAKLPPSMNGAHRNGEG